MLKRHKCPTSGLDLEAYKSEYAEACKPLLPDGTLVEGEEQAKVDRDKAHKILKKFAERLIGVRYADQVTQSLL